MKQCFTHRLPSLVTLLSDPWPEDSADVRTKVMEAMTKTAELRLRSKTATRLPSPRPQSPLK